jgi:hypothetical protein
LCGTRLGSLGGEVLGLPGLLVLSLGIWLGLDVVQTFVRVGVLLVGQLPVSVACAIVCTLSLFTATVLNALQSVRTELRSRR